MPSSPLDSGTYLQGGATPPNGGSVGTGSGDTPSLLLPSSNGTGDTVSKPAEVTSTDAKGVTENAGKPAAESASSEKDGNKDGTLSPRPVVPEIFQDRSRLPSSDRRPPHRLSLEPIINSDRDIDEDAEEEDGDSEKKRGGEVEGDRSDLVAALQAAAAESELNESLPLPPTSGGATAGKEIQYAPQGRRNSKDKTELANSIVDLHVSCHVDSDNNDNGDDDGDDDGDDEYTNLRNLCFLLFQFIYSSLSIFHLHLLPSLYLTVHYHQF